MTSGAATTVHRASKEAGGSMGIIIQMCSGTSWLILSCGYSYLNGVYYTDPKGARDAEGIKWYHWLGWDHSLKSTTMSIKRRL